MGNFINKSNKINIQHHQPEDKCEYKNCVDSKFRIIKCGVEVKIIKAKYCVRHLSLFRICNKCGFNFSYEEKYCAECICNYEGCCDCRVRDNNDFCDKHNCNYDLQCVNHIFNDDVDYCDNHLCNFSISLSGRKRRIEKTFDTKIRFQYVKIKLKTGGVMYRCINCVSGGSEYCFRHRNINQVL